MDQELERRQGVGPDNVQQGPPASGPTISSEVPPSKGSTTSPNYVTSWEPSVKTQELVREILHLNHRVLKPYP